jgi:hypothetical protein
MVYKATGEPWGLTFYSQTLSRRCPFKMGFAFEKQPKPENYQTTINRFKTF